MVELGVELRAFCVLARYSVMELGAPDGSILRED